MAKGTEVSTVRLWEFVNAHPGVTTDEIVAEAAREGFFPGGFARRRYAADLSHGRAVREGAGCSAPSRQVHPRDVDEHKAIHHVTRQALQGMKRYGSVRRDGDQWWTARPLRRYGIGALVVSREDVRADVALRNLRIRIGRDLEQIRNGTYLPRDLRTALLSWYEASTREYLDQQFGPVDDTDSH